MLDLMHHKNLYYELIMYYLKKGVCNDFLIYLRKILSKCFDFTIPTYSWLPGFTTDAEVFNFENGKM